MSPLESQSADSVDRVLMVSLTHLAPPVLPSSSSFKGLLKLHLIFGCDVLHLLPSVTEWNLSGLSDDDSTRLPSQNTLQAGKIVGWRFYDWVGVPIPPLKVLPVYRGCSVQVPCPLLLGVLVYITPIGSMEFPLHEVSTSRGQPF